MDLAASHSMSIASILNGKEPEPARSATWSASETRTLEDRQPCSVKDAPLLPRLPSINALDEALAAKRSTEARHYLSPSPCPSQLYSSATATMSSTLTPPLKRNSSCLPTPPPDLAAHTPPTTPSAFSDEMEDVKSESGSAAGKRDPRPTRLPYTVESAQFIWFCKLDLDMDWNTIVPTFDEFFPGQNRDGKQGLQCKYYRVARENGIPKERARKKGPVGRKMYALRVMKPEVWYQWMPSLALRKYNNHEARNRLQPPPRR